MRRRLIVEQSPPDSPLYWRQKSTTLFSNFSFTRLRCFFSVVAPKIFSGSGTFLSIALITLCIKGETDVAINMKAVPSLPIFQEISEIAMSGPELCPNA
jgi:hypothetical protein